MSARLLMIALDAADSRRLERWSDDGRLPNLAALRKKGLTRRLTAPPGATDDSLWASFQYAVDEGVHGRFFYRGVLRSGQLGWIFLEEGEREAFWHRLSAQGVRLAVFDVPKCLALKPVNGIHLANWLVHGRYSEQPQSFPVTLADEVLARFGPAPPSACGYYQPPLSDDRVREITRNLRASVAKKRAAALYYLGAEPWDLFIVGFKEAHCAGHGMWNFADRNHPEFDAARSERLGWPVHQIFRDIDAAIGDLVAQAGPEAEITVFSTTEMEPTGSLDHLMPQIVMRLNAALSGRPVTMPERALARLDAALPARPARWLARAAERLRRHKPAPGPVEMMPYSDNCGALRLTASSPADPDGRARMLREIDELLRDLTDVATGLPVVTSTTHPSAERHGARAASLPDVLIHYRSALVPRAIRSPRLGRISAKSPRRRPGNHAMGGLAVVAGSASLSAGAHLTALEDFAPFVAKILGLPDRADGA